MLGVWNPPFEYDFGMEVWVFMDLFGFCMNFVWRKKSNHKPNFDDFGLKEPYLVYWLCFGRWLVDYNPQLRNIYIKEILEF